MSDKIIKIQAQLEEASKGGSAFNTCSNGVGNHFSASASVLVKDSYTRANYDSARPSERLPSEFIEVLNFCNESYYTVPIIRNVIDLMSDFSIKGMAWAHPNRTVQAFYNNWFESVMGKDISERFSNYLLRLGSNCVIPDYSKIDESIAKEWKKTKGVEFKNISENNLRIPSGYSFIDITALMEEVSQSSKLNKTVYRLNTAGGRMASFSSYSTTIRFQQDYTFSTKLFQSLPSYLKKRAIDNKGNLFVVDGEDVIINHYRKDDWDSWARPIIYAVGEAIIMLKKMHLADMSALDGVISNVRLWTIGYIDQTNVINSIIPSATILNRVSNLIKQNVAGGVLDIVWGPDLTFKESSSSAHNFLKREKYDQVMSELYEGLGINPSISGGTNGAGGGMTNNAIALKVMVERLNYLRSKLTSFWMGESKKIQKAMGFSSPAQLTFDDAIFSDEVAYKKLLLELNDRNIISNESIREEFNFIDQIETSRVRKEEKRRSKGLIPPKASTFHDPMIQDNLKKDLIKNGQLDGEEMNLENVSQPDIYSKNPGGRPLGAKDVSKRAPKEVKPKAFGHAFVSINSWARDAYDKIGEIIGPHYLAQKAKSNFRQLTNDETNEFENLKLSILTNLRPLSSLDIETVKNAALMDSSCSLERSLRDSLITEMASKTNRQITMDDKRIASAGAYTISKLAQN